MMILMGLTTAAGGMFLFLWYRTLAGLPLKLQPGFIQPASFKWGVPAVSIAVFTAGILVLAGSSPQIAAGTVVGCIVLGFLIVRFDRYSAEIRLIHDHYLRSRVANPDLTEPEILFHTARWRYPLWSHDRLVELTAGKDIESLVLLMIINENQINPIRDWELYRSLKGKAARIIHAGK